MNAKRIYRLWRQEGLKVPKKTVKRRRLGSSEGGIVRRKSEHKDHVWSVDFIFDRTINGRSLKMLVVIDEYTRECIALEVGRKFTGDHFVETLSHLFAIRGVPKFIRSDNGPEFISRRVRDFLAAIDVGTCFIEPGSPWQNGYVESFNARLRDECLNCEEFTTVQEARVVIKHWRAIQPSTASQFARWPYPGRLRGPLCRFNSSCCATSVEAAQRTSTYSPTSTFITLYQEMGAFHSLSHPGDSNETGPSIGSPGGGLPSPRAIPSVVLHLLRYLIDLQFGRWNGLPPCPVQRIDNACLSKPVYVVVRVATADLSQRWLSRHV